MDKYKVGKIVVGNVTGIEKYGIFVCLDDYYSGLIHISEISSNFVKNVSDYVEVGETIRMKVIGVDDDNHHVKLSIKNFDYRVNRKRKTKIVETESGFTNLSTQLQKWIDDKIVEYEKI